MHHLLWLIFSAASNEAEPANFLPSAGSQSWSAYEPINKFWGVLIRTLVGYTRAVRLGFKAPPRELRPLTAVCRFWRVVTGNESGREKLYLRTYFTCIYIFTLLVLVQGTRSHFSLAVTMDTGVSGWSLICYLCLLCIFSEVLHKRTHTTGEETWCLAITGHRRTHSQFSFSGSFPSSIGWSDWIRSDSFPFKDSASDTQLPALAGSPSSPPSAVQTADVFPLPLFYLQFFSSTQ